MHRESPEYLLQEFFDERHAAAAKQPAISSEKMIGNAKRYRQLTTAMAAKQAANAHVIGRMRASACVGRPPSCHANIAAKK